MLCSLQFHFVHLYYIMNDQKYRDFKAFLSIGCSPTGYSGQRLRNFRLLAYQVFVKLMEKWDEGAA